jgi:hypothetical protein
MANTQARQGQQVHVVPLISGGFPSRLQLGIFHEREGILLRRSDNSIWAILRGSAAVSGLGHVCFMHENNAGDSADEKALAHRSQSQVGQP